MKKDVAISQVLGRVSSVARRNAKTNKKTNIMTTTTRNAAIKTARSNISSLYAFGDNHRYNYYCDTAQCWRESTPREYHAALASRSQALIDCVRDMMGMDAVQYDGGAWTDYV